MYNFMTEAVKRRFVMELRRFWSTHPKYRDIVDHIQMKYSSREQPQYGIVLKTSNANNVVLSADNFIGTVFSHCHMAKYENHPGLSLEWIREDSLAIQKNNGVFPSAPGIYYLDVQQVADTTSSITVEPKYEFYVDPLLEIQNETATKMDDFTWLLANPFLASTTKVYEMPGSIPLMRGVNYTEDPTSGEILLVNPLGRNAFLSVDYRYPAPSTGPWSIMENHANKGAIPGVVLAFGRRVQAGDKLAVVVHNRQQPTAQEFGGKWEISIDFDVIARDPYSQMEIVDSTVIFLWGVARAGLSNEGIEVMSVNMGGETEEQYDATGDDYFYNASFSVTVQTDWNIHVPISATIRRVIPQTQEQAAAVAGMTDEQLLAAEDISGFRVLEDMGLRSFEDPYFTGRTTSFETIK